MKEERENQATMKRKVIEEANRMKQEKMELDKKKIED